MTAALTKLYQPGQLITITFLEWDDAPHYSWPAEVLLVTPEAVLTRLRAGSTFTHHARGAEYRVEHDGLVAFWPDRWFSGGPDLDPTTGLVLEYYFNINTPPEFGPDGIQAVDLQLDVKAHANHSAQVFDEQEYLTAEARYAYPAWLTRQARLSVRDCLDLIERGAWPMRPAEAGGNSWLERTPGSSDEPR